MKKLSSLAPNRLILLNYPQLPYCYENWIITSRGQWAFSSSPLVQTNRSRVSNQTRANNKLLLSHHGVAAVIRSGRRYNNRRRSHAANCRRPGHGGGKYLRNFRLITALRALYSTAFHSLPCRINQAPLVNAFDCPTAWPSRGVRWATFVYPPSNTCLGAGYTDNLSCNDGLENIVSVRGIFVVLWSNCLRVRTLFSSSKPLFIRFMKIVRNYFFIHKWSWYF